MKKLSLILALSAFFTFNAHAVNQLEPPENSDFEELTVEPASAGQVVYSKTVSAGGGLMEGVELFTYSPNGVTVTITGSGEVTFGPYLYFGSVNGFYSQQIPVNFEGIYGKPAGIGYTWGFYIEVFARTDMKITITDNY